MSNHSILNETSENRLLVFIWEPKSGFIIIGCLLAVWLSIKSYQVIIDYIHAKPIETSVDTLNVALFRNIQLQSLVNLTLTILLHCAQETGEGLAIIVAWIGHNLSDCLILLLVASTILHQVLIMYPHLIAKDLTLAFQLVGSLAVILIIALDIVLFKMEHLPTLYYELRKVPDYQLKPFNLVILLRFVLLCLALPTMFILRLRIYIFHRGRDQTDSKVVSDKSLILILLLIFCTGLGARLGLVNRLAGREVAAYAILNVWPICIMMFSQKLRRYVIRRYDIEQRLRKKMFIVKVIERCLWKNRAVGVEVIS